MSQQRYNVFNQIHKALRALFYDTAMCIQQTDFDKPEAAKTIARVQHVLELLDDHSHHEDTLLFPQVMKYDRALAERFEKDHGEDHKLTEDLRARILEWNNTSDPAQKAAIGQDIFYAFNEFVAFNLYHMNREENELLQSLWANFTDEELMGIQMQIIASIKPEILMFEGEWMLRAMSNNEIIRWMTGVKMKAPAEQYLELVGTAQRVLPAERWAAVHHALEPKMELV